MKRFCLSLILLSVVVFAFVPVAVVAEDQLVTPAFGRLEISYAWFVGNTETMQNLASNVSGLEHFSEDFSPLPWQNYLEDKDNTRWGGATLTDGKKSYNLVVFPWQSQTPSSFDIEELTKKIAEHPLGKFYYPDGNFIISFRESGLAMLMPNDILLQFLVDKKINSDIDKQWQHLSMFLIAVYIDNSKIPPKEGETQDDSDENNERVTFGVYFEKDDRERERLAMVWYTIAPEDSPQAKAAAACFNNVVPFRVGGFFSKESSVKVSHRFFPEDVGLATHHFCVGGYLKPPESREENKIYSTVISLHTNKNNATIPDRNTVFRKGDFEFSFRLQEELPPEEGVPTAKEINAANMAFHKSLEPLANEIADKFAQAAAKGPVDIAAKIEDGIMLFAVAGEPGENDMAIDWNRLSEIDLTSQNFPNPYVDEQKTFLQDIVVSEGETWQDMTMANLVLTHIDRKYHCVLGQGNSLLCGALYLGEEDDEETIVPRMIAALKKGIEESQRIAAEEPIMNLEDIIQYDDETGQECFASHVGKIDEEYITVTRTYVTSSTAMMLAQLFGAYLVQ